MRTYVARAPVLLLLSGVGHLVVLSLLARVVPPPSPPALEAPVMNIYIVPASGPVQRARPSSGQKGVASPRRRPVSAASSPAAMSSIAAAGEASMHSLEPAGIREALSRILREGPVGCANPDAVGLTQEARERCDARLGVGALDAPHLQPPRSPARQAQLDGIARRKAADRRYREAQMPPGLSTSDAPGGLTGLGQTGHGSLPFP